MTLQYTTTIDLGYFREGYAGFRASRIRPAFRYSAIFFQLAVLVMAGLLGWESGKWGPFAIMLALVSLTIIYPSLVPWLIYRRRKDKGRSALVDVDDRRVAVTIEGLIKSESSWEMYHLAIMTKRGIVITSNGGTTFQYLRYKDMDPQTRDGITGLIKAKVKWITR